MGGIAKGKGMRERKERAKRQIKVGGGGGNKRDPGGV